MKKKALSTDDIVNWWLKKYHNTSTEQILKEKPEWKVGNHSNEFYQAYQVTQAQYDEWYEWFIATVMREGKMGRNRAMKESIWLHLDVAPMIKHLISQRK